jgi:hypothetical protein
MLGLGATLALALSFYAQFTSAFPVKRQSSSCNPVRFNTVLPTHICAESTIDFAWEGGSGRYNIFRWDQDQVSGTVPVTSGGKRRACY